MRSRVHRCGLPQSSWAWRNVTLAVCPLAEPVEPSAALLPIRTLDDAPCRRGAFLPHTLRFEPRASQTSALFVARIGKVAAKDALKVAHAEAEAESGGAAG